MKRKLLSIMLCFAGVAPIRPRLTKVEQSFKLGAVYAAKRAFQEERLVKHRKNCYI